MLPRLPHFLQHWEHSLGAGFRLLRGVAVARRGQRPAEDTLIYGARTTAGLTQAQLAKLIGTKQPVIARLEDADYHGHSLQMLQRIAGALHQRLELRFIPSGTTPRVA